MTARMTSSVVETVPGDHGATQQARIGLGIIVPSGIVRSVIRVRYLLADEKPT